MLARHMVADLIVPWSATLKLPNRLLNRIVVVMNLGCNIDRAKMRYTFLLIKFVEFERLDHFQTACGFAHYVRKRLLLVLLCLLFEPTRVLFEKQAILMPSMHIFDRLTT